MQSWSRLWTFYEGNWQDVQKNPFQFLLISTLKNAEQSFSDQFSSKLNIQKRWRICRPDFRQKDSQDCTMTDSWQSYNL
jgi:hypothetical protein